MVYNRPSWDDYFMDVVLSIAKRGTCDRGRAGAVIAKDKKILSTGYVGSSAGLPHCDDVGHQIKKVIHEDGSFSQHCTRTIHAEKNAICQAAKHGVSIDGGTVYTNFTPCKNCAMAIINSGIKRVVCIKKYHVATETEEMLKQAGVKLDYFTNELETYENQ